MKTLHTLSIKNARKHIGKKISWQAPANKANENYKGTSIIIEVDETKKNPIITETIKGDNLNYAFKESRNIEAPLAFSDEDRYITYVIEE